MQGMEPNYSNVPEYASLSGIFWVQTQKNTHEFKTESEGEVLPLSAVEV